MNPGKLNHRLQFKRQVSTQNDSGGSVLTYTDLVVSETDPINVTWGSLEPIKQWNQLAIEAGASVMTQDRVCILRYRALFGNNPGAFFKASTIEDLNNPGNVYMFHSILPYQPGSKSTFQNTDQQVYKDRVWVFMLVKLRV